MLTNRHIPLAILLFGLLLITTSVNAGHRFERYQLEQGLSQNTVNCLLQDSYGFLWVCTQDGLNRFDGYHFRVFKDNEKSGNTISDDYVISIIETTDRELWIGTRSGGLNRFDFETEAFESFRHTNQVNSLADDRVTALLELRPGMLIVGTYQGLNTLNTKKKHFERLNTGDNAQPLFITSLLKDSKQRLWVGTQDHGLLVLDSQSFKVLSRFRQGDASKLTSDSIQAIFEDSEHNIWVGTENGLNRLMQESTVFHTYSHQTNDIYSLSNNSVTDIIEVKQGELWIATADGINVFKPSVGRFVHIKSNDSDHNSLSGNSINQLYISRDKVLWVALFSKGLNKHVLNAQKFTHFKNNPNSLAANNIWAIEELDNTHYWIGTDGQGLELFNKDEGTFQHFPHQPNNDNSVAGNRIWAVLQYDKNEVWIGTYRNGLSRLTLDNWQFTHFRHDKNDANSLSSNRIVNLAKDSKGNLWVCTNNGLNLFNRDTQTFRRFYHQPDNLNSLPQNYVLDVTEDKRGNIWIGTYDKGATRYNPVTEQFTHFKHIPEYPNTLAHDQIMQIMEDTSGHLWFATYGRGVSVYNPETQLFRHYSTDDGLTDNAVYAIIEDNNHHMWFSTNNGISVMDPVAEKTVSYSVASGLQSTEFNAGAYLKASDGTIFLGGVNGFNLFDPNKIKPNNVPLPVSLTEFRVFNQPALISKAQGDNEPGFRLNSSIYTSNGISLSYKESLISFGFSTLNYAHANDANFQYKLDGFDQQWITTNHNARLATYTNLPAGDYTFKVRAKTSTGKWPETYTSLPLTVKPAPWLSWWAFAAYLVSILAILYAFIRQRNIKFQLIRESEARLSYALWGSQNTLIDWDVSNDTFVLASGKVADEKMRPALPSARAHLMRTVHKDDINHVETEVQQYIDNLTDVLDITYRITKDGELRWCRARGKAVDRDSQGKALRIVGTIEDIDQLIKIQHQLQQLNEQLEFRVKQRTNELSNTLETLHAMQAQLIESEKMASMVGLVSGVAHELNTPLGVIITAISHLEKNIDALLHQLKNKQLTKTELSNIEEAYNESLTLLNRNINKAIRLIQNFKSLSLNNKEDQSSTFDLNAVLEQLIESHLSVFAEHGISIHVNQDKNAWLYSYKSAVTDVIAQLFENAHTHAFSSTDTPSIELRLFAEDDNVVITYLDNGAGISDKEKDKVFEPFYTTKRGSDCTGLGMSIIYNLVTQRLRGTITLSDNTPTGLVVTITIPKKVDANKLSA